MDLGGFSPQNWHQLTAKPTGKLREGWSNMGSSFPRRWLQTVYENPENCLSGVDLNSVFRFVLFCFSFCFVFGGPVGGFGGPGGGFLLNSLSSGFATTFTTI